MDKDFTLPLGVKVLEETEIYGKYLFMPLEKGFGNTIGNALRRVLYSSVPGASITAIRIEGVPHELTTIEGVLEDVPDIILNLKRVRFKLNGNTEKAKAYIRKSGKGEIKAGDIDVTSDLEVVNKDQHIATLTSDNAALYAELIVSRGRGYVPAEELIQEPMPQGYIFVDGIFSPVRKVNYVVESQRVESRTDYERLTIEIWTDGTVTPDEAFREAVKVLIDSFQRMLRRVKGPLIEREAPKLEEKERIRTLLLKEIEHLELTVGTKNILQEAGIITIKDLVSKTKEDLLALRNFGEKSLKNLEKKLKEHGLKLGMDISQYLEEIEQDETSEKD